MVVKLKRIVIEHVKNVEHGSIDFTDGETFLNVTGIYGQNGSGKTTLVDVLDITRRIIRNSSLSDSYAGMLSEKNDARITIEIEELGKRVIQYIVVLKKIKNNNDGFSVRVQEESVITKILEKYKTYRKLAHYQFDSKEIIQFNINEKIASQDALNIISDVSADNKSSFLFSNSFKKLVKDADKFQELYLVLSFLNKFAHNLRIYTSEYAGLISANIVAPVGINYKDGDKDVHGLLPFHLRGSEGYIPKKMMRMYKKVIEQMNTLLPEIIPNLSLKMYERDIRTDKNGEEEVRLEFLSIRDGKQFSLHYESDGVKKIIGLIGYLVEVYNKPDIIAVIDELDSGIYEYLLGELIEVISTGAKGQLIFTSHNLRILEVLESNKVIFSTTNPKNRYIRMKGVKKSNNLRDMYLRTIQLGGQEENLYEGKSSTALRISLMRAGVGDE